MDSDYELSKKPIIVGPSSYLVFDLILGLLAYLIFGTAKAGVATFIFSFLVGIVCWFGLIPIGGPFVYWWLAIDWMKPELLQLGGIPPNFIFDLIGIFGLIFTIILTCVTTIGLLLLVFSN